MIVMQEIESFSPSGRCYLKICYELWQKWCTSRRRDFCMVVTVVDLVKGSRSKWVYQRFREKKSLIAKRHWTRADGLLCVERRLLHL